MKAKMKNKLRRGDLVLYNDPTVKIDTGKSHITWVSKVFSNTATILINDATKLVKIRDLTKLPQGTSCSISLPVKRTVFVTLKRNKK